MPKGDGKKLQGLANRERIKAFFEANPEASTKSASKTLGLVTSVILHHKKRIFSSAQKNETFSRTCHTCGKPTNDWECKDCQAKRHEKGAWA